MSEKTHHVAESKKKIAQTIQKFILEYPIIAAINMENLPAPQLQKMRAQLRGKIELTMTKRRIMTHAIEGIKDKKKNIEQLIPNLKGMPALLFTKENPFSLFKTLKKSKSSAPAKEGQTAPFDIIVPKGPTTFLPGPVIGELAMLGIKSGVEDGKVAIKEDSTAVKEGEIISAKAAEVLTRLGIEPMEVGLNVTAVYENGDIFKPSVLDIDEEKFASDMQKAASGAFNLAVNSAYPIKETINVLIGKAFNDAKALGLSQDIIDEGIIDELLGKAEKSALGIKSTANIETVDKPKEEKKEDAPAKKVEEKPKEAPKEPIHTPKETKTEQKEEKVLEEEKEIIKEEIKLEKEAKEKKIEAPVETEVKKEVKKEEEKVLENERIEKEKEFEKIEEKKAPTTDDKIQEMVSKTKKFVNGEIPSAEKLVEEAGKLAATEPQKKEINLEKPKASQKDSTPQNKEVPKEKSKDMEEVENLTQELLKKGTLRK
jgi:large subunit ribosomal protein L10